MTISDLLSSVGRWIYFSWPVRLLSARARGTYHQLAGDKARDRGDWATAAIRYQRCLTVFTYRHDLWIQLGNVRKEMGDLMGSRAAYEAALALAAGDSDLALQLGHLTKIQGSVDEAREWYLKALELDAHNQNAVAELAALGEELSVLARLLSSGTSSPSSDEPSQNAKSTRARPTQAPQRP